MDAVTADKLMELNRQFYQTFGAEFSATRGRLQPGVRRVLDDLNGSEWILDLGCGNGNLARELAKCEHSGSYLGLDFSLPLLHEAESGLEGFSATFLQSDITSPGWDSALEASSFDLVFAFAVLHHIPGEEVRLRLLQKINRLLKPGGRFILSNWQFLNSDTLKARIQDWEKAGLSPAQVDKDDYLLDWRSGGEGLRYVHHFTEAELKFLADMNRFRIVESFHSDGRNRKLGLYQIWERNSPA
jgi:tRNA (uracil-5-)-methyltransferase TRM9